MEKGKELTKKEIQVVTRKKLKKQKTNLVFLLSVRSSLILTIKYYSKDLRIDI
jgi:hypothetical protein